jgi:ADP-heptose:LPS heptosyltransferase
MSEFLCRYLSWAFGIEFDASFLVRYNFNLPEESIQRAKEYLISLGVGRKILINISARRKWSIDYYRELIQLLQKEFPNDVIVFVAHPSDYSMLDKILYGFDTNVFAFYGNSFYDVIALISMVDLVFTPDTSIVHFANAFGKRLVIIFPESGSFMGEWLPNNSLYLKYVSKSEKDNNDILPESIFESIKLLLNK